MTTEARTEVSEEVEVEIARLHEWDYERFLDVVSEDATGRIDLQQVSARAVGLNVESQSLTFEVTGYLED